MTFKELALQEDYPKLASMNSEQNESLWKTLFFNHSPVMRMWFILMIINLIMVIWLI